MKKKISNEFGYQIEKALAKQLLIMGLITQEQYSRILNMLVEEYGPLIGPLCEAEHEAEHNQENTES